MLCYDESKSIESVAYVYVYVYVFCHGLLLRGVAVFCARGKAFMTQLSQLFADRVINVAVTGPLIRLELGAMAPPAAEGENPSLQVTQTLVMPLDGFLASFGMLETVVKKMVADGMLKLRPPAEPFAAPNVSDVPPNRQ